MKEALRPYSRERVLGLAGGFQANFVEPCETTPIRIAFLEISFNSSNRRITPRRVRVYAERSDEILPKRPLLFASKGHFR
jgi:hypothetical protein